MQTGNSIEYHTKQAEHILGEIQISKRWSSEVDVVQEDILAPEKEEVGGVMKYTRTINGYEHLMLLSFICNP